MVKCKIVHLVFFYRYRLCIVKIVSDRPFILRNRLGIVRDRSCIRMTRVVCEQ